MSDDDLQLIGHLAAVDAIFTPLREFAAPGPSNVYVARRDYLRAGLPWTGGGTGAERQAASRTLHRLERAGLLRVKHRQSRPHVRLSDAAEDRFRAMVGLPDVASGWATLTRLARLTTEHDRRWVPEWILADVGDADPTDPDGAERLLAQAMALPALCRGWVSSGSTPSRHVGYTVTAAGKRAAKEVKPPADFDRDDLFDADAEAHYLGTFTAYRDGLFAGDAVEPREIGAIPLSLADLHWPTWPATLGRTP